MIPSPALQPILALAAEADPSNDVIYTGAYIGLALALLLALLRFLRGPTMPDRVVALDLMAIFAAATIGLTAITTGTSELIIVAIVLALLMFMGTTVFAMYLERKGRADAP